jgi:hypothetical protein
MSVQVKSIASSISEDTGIRLDTLQVRYWRAIHGEVMTHRVFSRNASSSRAIPYASLLVRDADMFVPRFRKNKPGMQPGDFLDADDQEKAERIWRDMADYVLKGTRELSAKSGLNIHKQWVNRPLEWFGYIDVLITSTEWSNFDGLRIHGDAQDEIRELATEMKRVRDAAVPRTLRHGQWHLPYIRDEDFEIAEHAVRRKGLADDVMEVIHPLMAIKGLDGAKTVSARNALLLAQSAARCCRLSYSKHDGEPPAISDDMRRYSQLAGSDPKHASPLEHQARPLLLSEDERRQGNFVGWAQFRKFLPNENIL